MQFVATSSKTYGESKHWALGALSGAIKFDLFSIGSCSSSTYSCLDDEELELLGASWPDYSQASRELGLDILR